MTFPPDFELGVATASYQIEGSPLADGAEPSIWHRFAHTPGTVSDGGSGDVACDSYRRWKDDVGLLRELGVSAYRFSVAWPRVVPGGAGATNAPGLDFYDRFVDALVEAGIRPFVTLYHWDLPGALQDHGGWANRDTADHFAEYAARVFERLGDRVTAWITLNEPVVTMHAGHVAGRHAPGMRDLWAASRVAQHLLVGHGLAVEAFRSGNHPGTIGITNVATVVEPASAREEDHVAQARADALLNRLFVEPVLGRGFPEELLDWYRAAWPEPSERDVRVIGTPVDFFGINYYSRTTVAAPLDGPQFGAVEPPEGRPLTAMGWQIYPEGLGQVFRRFRDGYGNPPVYVTENGAAFDDVPRADGHVDDQDRIAYLEAHFEQAASALADGVDLRGYFVWTLMDNFEWAHGFSKRFGLYHVDRETFTRRPKASAAWYRRLIESRAVPGIGPAGHVT